jgi:hypothetical protein
MVDISNEVNNKQESSKKKKHTKKTSLDGDCIDKFNGLLLDDDQN